MAIIGTSATPEVFEGVHQIGSLFGQFGAVLDGTNAVRGTNSH